MAGITRRQILLGAGALAGAGLIPSIPKTPLTPAMQIMRSALGANIPQPDHVIRAHANENPYGPSRVAMQSMLDNFDMTNLYADDPTDLLALQSRLNGVTPDNIMIGTGSSEILNVAGLLAGMHQGSVVCADPTYQSLLQYAENAGSEIIRIPVTESLGPDLDAMRRAIRSDTRLVYLVNPNNPVPSVIEKVGLREFVSEVARSRLVFVDEAYHEFVDDPDYESMVSLVAAGQKNLIVSRTASKIHGLAGMRIGFGFAQPELIEQMLQRRTGRINILGLKAAHACYLDQEFQNFTIRKNKESLAIVQGMCDELGIRYIKSNANFAFIETGIENQDFQATMLDHGIMTGRDFPPYTNWARISMAKPEDMKYFVQVYKTLYA
jgi:histidinol-phosphate aminotransferase